MVNYVPEHDFGSKTLLSGYVAAANLSTAVGSIAALDNIASHPNIAPFISKQLIQHLVRAIRLPAYVARVAAGFHTKQRRHADGHYRDSARPEARANDAGGNDQPTDGHLQEPALFIPGLVRAFGGTMTTANYYTQTWRSLGQDIYNPASVFNYFSPGYTVRGTGRAQGSGIPDRQSEHGDSAREPGGPFFNQYSNPVQSYGPEPGRPDAVPAAGSHPAALVAALDLTLTHGTMPAAMKQIIVNAVTADKTARCTRCRPRAI